MFDEEIINGSKYYIGGHVEGIVKVDDIILFLDILQINKSNVIISDLNSEENLYENLDYTFIRNESIRNIKDFIKKRKIWKEFKDINNEVLWPIIKINLHVVKNV